jgi:hypothetical protein
LRIAPITTPGQIEELDADDASAEMPAAPAPGVLRLLGREGRLNHVRETETGP